MTDFIKVRVSKKYQEKTVFDGLKMDIVKNKINCVLGYSGSGKTTLLNILSNSVDYDGSVEGGTDKISYIFQEDRLLKNLKVRENIEYVLYGLSKEMRRKRADEMLQMVEMGAQAEEYPAHLSGGMAQRVSMARAFAFRSELLLMDEPFKALDIGIKRRLISSFIKLWERDKRTVIFVTHGIDEALLLADEIFVFGGSPTEVVYRAEIKEKKEERRLDDEELGSVRNSLLKLF